MTYCNYKNLGDQFEMFTNIEPLCCAPGTKGRLSVNYISTNRQIGRERDQICGHQRQGVEGWGIG